eukprot:scaffold263378_cov18-Tisochrysis_lutea.AAC.1
MGGMCRCKSHRRVEFYSLGFQSHKRHVLPCANRHNALGAGGQGRALLLSFSCTAPAEGLLHQCQNLAFAKFYTAFERYMRSASSAELKRADAIIYGSLAGEGRCHHLWHGQLIHQHLPHCMPRGHGGSHRIPPCPQGMVPQACPVSQLESTLESMVHLSKGKAIAFRPVLKMRTKKSQLLSAWHGIAGWHSGELMVVQSQDVGVVGACCMQECKLSNCPASCGLEVVSLAQHSFPFACTMKA